MICQICNKEFEPSKYHAKRQLVCASLPCQHARHLKNLAAWRKNNPNYFKYTASSDPIWKEMRRQQIRDWRKNHPERLQMYRQKHKDKHREYMRVYMQQYRVKNAAKASETKPVREADNAGQV